MTDSPNVRLEREGIDRDRIEWVRDQIAATVRDYTGRADEAYSDDDHIRLEQAVSDEIFESLLEYGDSPRTDEDTTEWFERVAGEFEAPTDQPARTNVSLTLGKLAVRDDAPDVCYRLSNDLLEQKYRRED